MNIYNDIIGCKYDLIKILLFKKNSLNKKELKDIKEKLILINQIIKAYKNNEKFIFDQSLFKDVLNNNIKTR